MDSMRSLNPARLIAFALIFACLAPGADAQLVFDDPLTGGTTIGVRDNGQGVFVPAEGWKVTSYSDNIRYTPPTPIENGAAEFNVKGLIQSDDLNPDGQLMSMYDAEQGCFRYSGRKSKATDLGAAGTKYWLFQRIEEDWLTYRMTRIAANLAKQAGAC